MIDLDPDRPEPARPPARRTRRGRGALSGLQRLALAAARALLRLAVRHRSVPEDPARIGIDRSLPVCYALQIRQLSAYLVLDDAARQLGLPLPSAPLAAGTLLERSSFFFLTRSGQPSPLRRNPYEYSKRLERLVAAVETDPLLDVQIVPVSIFWGRAPDKQPSVLKALLADGWAAPGPFKQLLRLLIHGRQTLLSFGEPISLRAVLADSAGEAQERRAPVRRVARLLRAQFRRERELAVGPNLSHRQTVINTVIDAGPVREAIREEAQRRRITPEQAELAARRIAYEIASDYSYPFIRAWDRGLSALWNRIYEGVEVHRFEDVARAGAGTEIVYVPCHRSHVDYLLLSYLIFHRGLLPPHIAAGSNLNLPVAGTLLRRGGAFFLRRSLKGEALFAAVFKEYLHTIMQRGFPIEFFIEGGRSRTGRMLPPKTGMLGMTVDSFLRDPRRPVVYVPVYIGYEQLIEGDSYVAELAGEPKRKESVAGVLRTLAGIRRRRFGKVHVNIGEPIRLQALLDAQWPDWRAPQREGDLFSGAAGAAAVADRREAAVRALAGEITRRINDALVINPVNLLATAMLGAPRLAMDAGRLAEQIDLLAALAARQPYSERQELTALDGEAAIGHALSHGLVERIAHPLGDIVRVLPRHAPLLPYFRNNVLHAWALPSLVACLAVRDPQITVLRIRELARQILPFLRAEMHLSWPAGTMDARVDACIDLLAELGLLRVEGSASVDRPALLLRELATQARDDALLYAPAPTQRESLALATLAQVIREPLERYFVAVKTLAGAGSGTLSPAALEERCVLLAQRFAYLYEAGAGSLSDPVAFRGTVATLQEAGLARLRDGCLHYDQALELSARDADHLLSDELRLAIAHAGQLPQADLAQAPALLPAPAGGRRERKGRA